MSAPIAPAPSSAGSPGGSAAPAQGAPAVKPTGAPGAPPPEAGGEEPEALPVPKRLKRVEKVNGQDVELEATEEELWAAKRRERAVHDNARKVAEERKKFEADRKKHEDHLRRVKEDPFYTLREQEDFDEVEFLQQRLHGLLKDQNRDPRDLALSQKERQLQEKERQLQEKEDAEHAAQERAEEDQQLRRDGALMAKALKDGKLPADDLTLELMLKAHYTAQEEEGLELTPAELAQETRRMMTSALDNCVANLEGDQLLDAFPQLSQKIHRALVDRYKRQQSGGAQQKAAPPQPAKPAVDGAGPNGKRLTEREQHELEEKAAGRRIMRWGV